MPVKAQSRIWMILAVVMTIVSVCLLIAVIALAVKDADSSEDSGGSKSSSSAAPVCGTRRAGNRNTQTLTESKNPGPFHDLTASEMKKLRKYLEDSNLNVYRAGRDDFAFLTTKASIITMDLLLPAKSEVLSHLDGNSAQPERRARVMLARRDLPTQVIEEFSCGPLPDVTSCERLETSSRRNPVEMSLSPLTLPEFMYFYLALAPQINAKLGNILEESFGAQVDKCGAMPACLDFQYAMVPSDVHGNMTKRVGWLVFVYKLESKYLRPVDFAIMVETGADGQPVLGQVWYNGQRHDSMDAFATAYSQDSIPKIRITAPSYNTNHFSMMTVRGTSAREPTLRPPTLVEPDGKRFSVKHRQVTYLGWRFDFGHTALRGPAIYDVRYKGERIVYELGIQELGVFYSGNSEPMMTQDLLDSGTIMGTFAKTLVPGVDCPTTAVFVSRNFASILVEEPVEYSKTLCIFEQNDGIPLSRHGDYSDQRFFSGLPDSYLTLRTILTIGNYDYIIDFMFHQNGVLDTRATSTGYIMSSVWSEQSRPYGHRLRDNILGNLHHHMFHFKVDLDIKGTSNRYETLDVEQEEATLSSFQGKKHPQYKMSHNLKQTEQEALYNYNFDKPKYHVVHNNASRTEFGEIQAYRLHISGMSKQLLPQGEGTEKTIPWARHQLVVTRHRDNETESSSPYAAWDSLDPVTDFSQFYANNDNIVDEDLVFWVSMGTYHIPQREDLPVTTTSGTRLSFSLLPHNYFPESPSVSSRDSIRAQPWDLSDPSKGVAVMTNGKPITQCTTPRGDLYTEEVKDDPEVVVLLEESNGML